MKVYNEGYYIYFQLDKLSLLGGFLNYFQIRQTIHGMEKFTFFNCFYF